MQVFVHLSFFHYFGYWINNSDSYHCFLHNRIQYENLRILWKRAQGHMNLAHLVLTPVGGFLKPGLHSIRFTTSLYRRISSVVWKDVVSLPLDAPYPWFYLPLFLGFGKLTLFYTCSWSTSRCPASWTILIWVLFFVFDDLCQHRQINLCEFNYYLH